MIFFVFVRVCLAFTFCSDMRRYPKTCQVFLTLFRYALVLRYVPQRCPGCSQSGPQRSDLQGANQPQIRVQIMICRWFASTLDLHSDLQLANHDLQWFACKLPYNSSCDLHPPIKNRPGLAEERKAQGLPSRYWERNAHGPSYTKINYSPPDVPSYSIHAQVNS